MLPQDRSGFDQEGRLVNVFGRWSRASRRATAQAHAITRFWSWWDRKGARDAATAIAAGEPERMFGPLARHLTAIHPGLVWEFGTGPDGENVLVVTSEGDPALRAITSRWRQAAPPPNELWDYSSARLPVADPSSSVLTLGGAQIDVTSVTVSADVSRSHVDVTMYHPGFADLPADQHMVTAFMLLDTVLGEAAVDSWVGTVTAGIEPPPDLVPLTDLPAVVSELEAELTDADGERPWLVTRWTADSGAPVLSSTQVPLRAASAPHLDTYVDVSLSFSEWTSGGLPAPASLKRLREFQDLVSSRLGARGRVVAHETREGIRTLHLYVDSSTSAIKQVREAIAGWNQGSASVTPKRDPAWECVRHLRS
jgi:hypothetical protein